MKELTDDYRDWPARYRLIERMLRWSADYGFAPLGACVPRFAWQLDSTMSEHAIHHHIKAEITANSERLRLAGAAIGRIEGTPPQLELLEDELRRPRLLEPADPRLYLPYVCDVHRRHVAAPARMDGRGRARRRHDQGRDGVRAGGEAGGQPEQHGDPILAARGAGAPVAWLAAQRRSRGRRNRRAGSGPGAALANRRARRLISRAMKPFRNEPILELRRAAVRAQLADALRAHDARGAGERARAGSARTGGRAELVSTDPGAPDRVVAQAAAATEADVDAAVAAAAARRAGGGGAARRPSAREILLRAAQWLRERRLEVAALEVRECAKPWPEADGDVCEAIDFLEYYARGAVELARRPPTLDPAARRAQPPALARRAASSR